MIELSDPAENPAGDGPGDTNPLLDALRDGQVIRVKGERQTWTNYFQMVQNGKIRRTTYDSNRRIEKRQETMGPLRFAGRIARLMGYGDADVSLVSPVELEQRESEYRTERAFKALWRMELRLDREDDKLTGELVNDD